MFDSFLQLHCLPAKSLLLKFLKGLGMVWSRRKSSKLFAPSSILVQPVAAKQWAESFSSLMASKYGTALFRAFLLLEFSHDNLDFCAAVEIYKKSKPQEMLSEAQKIYDNFVAVHSPNEVNLDPQTRSTILNKISSNHADGKTFDQAQKRIQHIMEQDPYARFLKSEPFLELIHPGFHRKAL